MTTELTASNGIRVVSDDAITRVYVNDTEVHGVTRIEAVWEPLSLPEIRITIMGNRGRKTT